MVYNYGSMGIWGIALITQILSTVGILADINMLTWTFVVMIGGLFVTLSYEFLQLLGIQAAYDQNQAGVSAAITGALVTTLSNEWLMVTAG